MEMDDRECAKCQKSKIGDTNGINGKFNDNRTKVQIVSSPSSSSKGKTCRI